MNFAGVEPPVNLPGTTGVLTVGLCTGDGAGTGLDTGFCAGAGLGPADAVACPMEAVTTGVFAGAGADLCSATCNAAASRACLIACNRASTDDGVEFTCPVSGATGRLAGG